MTAVNPWPSSIVLLSNLSVTARPEVMTGAGASVPHSFLATPAEQRDALVYCVTRTGPVYKYLVVYNPTYYLHALEAYAYVVYNLKVGVMHNNT